MQGNWIQCFQSLTNVKRSEDIKEALKKSFLFLLQYTQIGYIMSLTERYTPMGFEEAQEEISMEDMNNVCPGCSHRTKERSEKEKKSMLNRLSRIEGQVRGIRKMVENDAYCPDILIQVSAVNAALNSFNKVLLAEHIRTCVTDDIREGKEGTIDELVLVLQKLMK